jgi:hypothetical protein
MLPPDPRLGKLLEQPLSLERAKEIRAGGLFSSPLPNGHAKPAANGPDLRAFPMSGVEAEPVEWLWSRWIPRAMLSILDGNPGLGKSTITADLAARVSRGWPMPPAAGGVQVSEPRGVVILSAEDSPAHTIKPRLDVAGADCDRVFLVGGITERETEGPVVLPAHLDLIETLAGDCHAGLIIVDPIVAYIDGELNCHNDQHVRLVLHRLKLLAERTGAAVLVLRHLNKLVGVNSAIFRGGGSIGFTAAARSAMTVGRDPSDPASRVLAMAKLNVGPSPRSLTYSLVDAGPAARIGWGEESDLSADDIVALPAQRRSNEAAAEAERFLSELLAGGPVPVKDIEEKAEVAGIKRMTLRRAKTNLRAESFKAGFGSSSWSWRLPPTSEGAHPTPHTHEMSTFEGNGAKTPVSAEGAHFDCVKGEVSTFGGGPPSDGPYRDRR